MEILVLGNTLTSVFHTRNPVSNKNRWLQVNEVVVNDFSIGKKSFNENMETVFGEPV